MDTQEQIDPTALALKRAIFKQEGNDYHNTSGDSHTSAGAGQWNNGKLPLEAGKAPSNFRSAAQNFGLDPNDFSEEAQDHVAYLQVKKDLDDGLTQSQIAAKWNSGLTHDWENHKGTTTINGKTISYDTPAYVNNVKKYYEEFVNGAQPTNRNSSPVGKPTDLTKDIIVSSNDSSQPEQQTPSQSEFTKAGQELGQGHVGKALLHGASGAIQGFGNFITGGGANTLGQSLGTNLGFYGEKIKDVVKGTDNAKYYDTTQPTIKDVTKAGLKTGVAVGTLAAGGGLLGKLLTKAPALENPIVSDILQTRFGPKAKILSNLPKAEVENTLSKTLEELSVSQRQGKEGQAILKAIQELNPGLTQKRSLIARLAKGGFNTAKNYLILKLLGEKIGGAVHKITD